MEMLTIKYLHILSATILFGTGIGSAFYKFMADRQGNIAAITHTNKTVVLADWLFTTPTVIAQPLTGVGLMYMQNYALSTSWLMVSILLYLFAGACWLYVVYLQISMRNLAQNALDQGSELPVKYHQQAKTWFWLGVPAFSSIIFVYFLMVVKPTLW